jgi:hypothetical protein
MRTINVLRQSISVPLRTFSTGFIGLVFSGLERSQVEAVWIKRDIVVLFQPVGAAPEELGRSGRAQGANAYSTESVYLAGASVKIIPVSVAIHM